MFHHLPGYWPVIFPGGHLGGTWRPPARMRKSRLPLASCGGWYSCLMRQLSRRVKALARETGADLVGVTDARRLTDAPLDQEVLDWLSKRTR
jgi:hypothetical protein